MGFNASLKKVKFSVTDPEDQFCGLEFRTRSMSMLEFSTFAEELTSFAGFDASSTPTTELMQRALGLYKVFVPYLIDWNVEQEDPEHEGEEPPVMVPVEPTLEGIQKIDPELALFIATTWMTKVVGVRAPLGKTSNAGATSAVASIPMAISSPSLAS
jgi:hypothetical protein